MGNILHGIATTTPRIRKEIQDAQESLATLYERYRIKEKALLYYNHQQPLKSLKLKTPWDLIEGCHN